MSGSRRSRRDQAFQGIQSGDLARRESPVVDADVVDGAVECFIGSVISLVPISNQKGFGSIV